MPACSPPGPPTAVTGPCHRRSRCTAPPLTSASFGPGGSAAVITTANRGQIITGEGSSWLPLPPLPPGTATLAPGPGGAAEALAVHGGTLTVWQHVPGDTTWAKAQVVNVPIPYGSSS